MKILKTLGFLLLGLVALALIIGAFQPTHFEFESSTDMNASKDIIFSKIEDLKAWEEWGPWKAEDSTIVSTYNEQTSGVDAFYTWTSEKAGNGKMTITESTPPTWHKSHLEFDGQDGGDGWFKIEDGENDANKVTWGMEFDIPYPFNAMTLFTGSGMEKQINKMFGNGLANMKAICEKEASEKTYRGYKISSMEFPGKSYLSVRETVNMADMKAFYAKSFGAIMGGIESEKLETDGMPCGVFYKWDEETGTTDMAAAIPVKGGTPAAAGILKPLEIPKGKCMTIDYYGDYAGSVEAHYGMEDYFKANGLESSKLVMEEYVTDPSTETDPSKWLTKIYYFLDGPIASGE